jgi:hypothetical protein
MSDFGLSVMVCENCFRQDVDNTIKIRQRMAYEYNFRRKLCSIRH